MRTIIISLVIISVPYLCFANTIHVPGDSATIQAGINGTVNGDTVLVAPGTYYENVDYFGKVGITLLSSGGRDETFIEPGVSEVPIIHFSNPADSSSVLDGFTIRNASNAVGIYCNGSPTIQNCDVSHCNNGGHYGGGIWCEHSAAKIRHNLIHNNSGYHGGGIGGGGDSIDISYNIIYNNNGNYGSAVHLYYYYPSMIHHNLMRNNSGGSAVTFWGPCDFFNNTIVNNTSAGIEASYTDTKIINNIVAFNQDNGIIPEDVVLVDYNDVWANGGVKNYPGPNGISADPMFTDTTNYDYTLQEGSPCIDAGDPDPQYIDPDGTRNDMGAFSFFTTYPFASNICTIPSENAVYTPSLTPEIKWTFNDTISIVQNGYHIQIGTDSEWPLAEMWDTGPIFSPDTIVAYDGISLGNHTKYYLRIKVYNGSEWGDWRCSYFITDVSNIVSVPMDKSTIQTGIDVAGIGDTVLVAPGTYYENVDFFGKVGITLLSSGGRDETFIEPAVSDIPIIHFSNPADSSSVLDGFTIRNASNAVGIYCSIGGPTIQNCDVSYCNNNGSNGGGIWCEHSAAKIRHNLIHNNSGGHGGGIGGGGDSIDISYNIIYNNNGSYGSAVHLYYTIDSYPSIIHHNLMRNNTGGSAVTFWGVCDFFNNTIVNNTGAGIEVSSWGVKIINNIVAFNQSDGIIPGDAIVDYNDVWGNGGVQNYPGPNGISADPMFTDTTNYDYALQEGSPCIDAGDPDPQYIDPDGTRNDMGAFPFLQSNPPPVIEPIENVNAIEGDTISFGVIATDPDFTIPSLYADNIPDSASFIDNHNGTGYFSWPVAPKQYGSYEILFIASDGEFADSEEVTIEVSVYPPEVESITVDNQENPDHVISNEPVVAWDYWDFGSDDQQAEFQVAVGTDDDWAYAEMWNPAPIPSSDTFISYAGLVLNDGETYYMRLRVSNGLAWSNWYEISFRMNSVPSIPVPLSPLGGIVVENSQPMLYIQNSTDAEGDELTYDFIVYPDTDFVLTIAYNIQEQSDSTGWMVDVPLDDNAKYFWGGRSDDSYEQSGWSELDSFWVNSVEESPTAFTLSYPPDTGWSQVYNFPETFWWAASTDPDPFDSVYYRLYVSIDSEFTFVATYDSIYQTSFSVPALEYGTHYWWKVMAIDTKGNETECDNIPDFLTWVLGDANADNSVNLGDAVFLINLVFNNGPVPDPFKIGDVNGDCYVNLGDAVYLVNYVFNNGPEPLVGCDEPPEGKSEP